MVEIPDSLCIGCMYIKIFTKILPMRFSQGGLTFYVYPAKAALSLRLEVRLKGYPQLFADGAKLRKGFLVGGDTVHQLFGHGFLLFFAVGIDPVVTVGLGAFPQLLQQGGHAGLDLLLVAEHAVIDGPEAEGRIGVAAVADMGRGGAAGENGGAQLHKDAQTVALVGAGQFFAAAQRENAAAQLADDGGLVGSVLSYNPHFIVSEVNLFNENLGFPAFAHAKKPFKKNLLRAMTALGTGRAETIFIGDQIYTDVWAARNAGIRAILVPPINDKRDIFTKFKRLLERGVLRKYYKRSKRFK